MKWRTKVVFQMCSRIDKGSLKSLHFVEDILPLVNKGLQVTRLVTAVIKLDRLVGSHKLGIAVPVDMVVLEDGKKETLEDLQDVLVLALWRIRVDDEQLQENANQAHGRGQREA